MTLHKKILSYIPALLLTFLLAGIGVASANPSYFAPRAQTAVATTTPTYMTPGTGTTTTPVYDSYSIAGTQETSSQTTQTINTTDSAELLIQFTASSTSSKLLMNLEYSVDGVDWYQDTSTNVQGYATTTLPIPIGNVPQYTWNFASSTLGQLAPTNTNRDTRAVSIPVPTRYVRAVFTCTGAGCGVWAQFIPKKQTP